jgi:CDP-glucose 4,6-dehydratase
MGTVNVLDEAFATDYVQAVIVVTTDKVYRNSNTGRAFIESDPFEGKDPYSASKVGAEAAVSAWQQIQKVSGGPKVVSVRAGNVIGGGDWAQNRLVPDLVRGFISGTPAEIRNPTSTRPWQHVLDPLVGYLSTLEYILNGGDVSCINFAPNGASLTVAEVATIAQECWGKGTAIEFSQAKFSDNFEASSLALDASYASRLFKNAGHWNQEKSIQKSVTWWKKLTEKFLNPQECTKSDIQEFLSEIEGRKDENFPKSETL